MKWLGSRIRALRKLRGLSMQHVADFCGVSRPTYAIIESSRSNPSIKVLYKLCEVLKISFYDLTKNEGGN